MTDKRSNTPASLPKPAHVPVNPDVAAEGVPGFHHTLQADGSTLAAMEPDADTPGRVNTGTGDQPSNTGGDRFATPSVEVE
jgi:hypothetical protein